jgi:hypothetical protein
MSTEQRYQHRPEIKDDVLILVQSAGVVLVIDLGCRLIPFHHIEARGLAVGLTGAGMNESVVESRLLSLMNAGDPGTRRAFGSQTIRSRNEHYTATLCRHTGSDSLESGCSFGKEATRYGDSALSTKQERENRVSNETCNADHFQLQLRRKRRSLRSFKHRRTGMRTRNHEACG